MLPFIRPELRNRLLELVEHIQLEDHPFFEELQRSLKHVQGKRDHVRRFLERLKRERIKQNLSLRDVQSRTGIARESLFRLESFQILNPTFDSLQRYADGLGFNARLRLLPKAKKKITAIKKNK